MIDVNQLKIGDTYAEIEERSGKRKFYLESELSGILEYEKKMLINCECSDLLPVNLLKINNIERVYFDFTGYIQLSIYIKNYEQINNNQCISITHSALEIIEKVITAVKNIEDFLLSYDGVPLLTDGIFINPDNRNIAIIYIPSICEKIPIQNKIIRLIESIDYLYDHSSISLGLRELKEKIHVKNLGLDGIIKTVGNMIREISFSEWTKQSFRELERNKDNDIEKGADFNIDQISKNDLFTSMKFKRDKIIQYVKQS